MKNACLLLRKKVTADDASAAVVLDAFFLGGYAFDEVRILQSDDVNGAKKAVAELKTTSDIILIITDKMALSQVKRVFLDVFPENSRQNVFGEAGIYSDGNKMLMLLSADGTETGVGYVNNACIPYLQQKTCVRFDKITIRSVGASENRIDALIAQAQKLGVGKIRFVRSRNYDEEILQIVYDSNTPKMLIDDVLRLFADGLGDTVYALNDVSLEKQVIDGLKVRRKKISVAESFTGGGIARRLTSVSGASEVYFEGLNTYDEKSKIQRLGVTEYTLKTQGAVSDQTAYEMAYGLLATGNCDVAVATTGLAGPKSDRSGLPVGLCYIAVGTKERIRVYRYIFDGDRKSVTEKAINYALFYAYRQLKDL